MLADRIRTEYDLPVHFEGTPSTPPAGSRRRTTALLKKFADANRATIAEDHTGAPVFLARNAWHLKTTGEEWPGLKFLKTKEQVQ